MNFASTELNKVYKDLRKILQNHAYEQSDLEARIILQKRAGLSWSDIISQPQTIIAEEALKQIQEDLEERLNHAKPLSRIYGEREFWGLSFLVSSYTLDPRPDTETLIERALDLFHDNPPEMILDLGTGTGCILITLLNVFKSTRGVAVDKSYNALLMAQQNATLNRCAERIDFICGSWGDSIAKKFDLIVSNPPYIVRGVIPTLDAEVKNHDPILALDGGEDGLDAYREIFSQLKNILSTTGKALFEIGYDQGETVSRLAEESGLVVHGVFPDLAGSLRVVEISCGDK